MTVSPNSTATRTDALDWDYLTGEYEFMRSFGMGHEMACRRIGVTVNTFAQFALRNNYPVKL